MAEKQTPHVMGRLVQHQAHINSLTTEEATWVGEYPAQALELFVEAISRSLKQPFFSTGEVLLPETGLRRGQPVQSAVERERGAVDWKPLSLKIRGPARYRPACAVTLLASRKDVAATRLCQFVLDSADDEPAQIGRALIVRGHTLTRAQIVNLVSRSEMGESVGLSRDGRANYFLEETEEEDVPVLLTGVVRAHDSRRSVWQSNSQYLGPQILHCEQLRFLIANAQGLRF